MALNWHWKTAKFGLCGHLLGGGNKWIILIHLFSGIIVACWRRGHSGLCGYLLGGVLWIILSFTNRMLVPLEPSLLPRIVEHPDKDLVIIGTKVPASELVVAGLTPVSAATCSAVDGSEVSF